jgi:hypothetical protein
LDTTGAGDTLHGAFAARIARGENFLSALHFACAAAALSCTRYGARPSIPTGLEVETFLEGQQGMPTIISPAIRPGNPLSLEENPHSHDSIHQQRVPESLTDHPPQRGHMFL